MKRFFVTLGIFALFIGVFSLTACGGGEQDPALVGTWEWDGGPEWRYVFNADGTGDRGVPGFQLDTFSWSTNGDRLNIRRDSPATGERRNERWTYIISGNSMTLDSQQEDLFYSYTRRP